MNYSNKLLFIIEKKLKSLKQIEKNLSDFIHENNDNVLFSMNKNLINSFVTIMDLEDTYKYKYTKRFIFDNINSNTTPLIEIFNALKVENNNSIQPPNCEKNSDKYINHRLIINIFKYIDKDQNFIEEKYEYINYKLQKYYCCDIETKEYLENSFNYCSAKMRNNDNNLLNVNQTYFDEEFKLFNIFSKNQMFFGDYLKELWIKNCESNEHNILEPFINLLVHKIKLLNTFINKNTSEINIKKDLNLNDDFKFIIGDLNIYCGGEYENVSFALKNIFNFLKLLFVFLCLLERTNINKKIEFELKYIENKKNHKIFNEFNESFMSSLNIIMEKDKYRGSKNYDKLVNILNEDNISFSFKMVLFNNYFESILNTYYYDYNDSDNYSNYLDNMNNIKNIVKNLIPEFWNEKDLKNYTPLKGIINHLYIKKIYQKISFDEIDIE